MVHTVVLLYLGTQPEPNEGLQWGGADRETSLPEGLCSLCGSAGRRGAEGGLRQGGIWVEFDPSPIWGEMGGNGSWQLTYARMHSCSLTLSDVD